MHDVRYNAVHDEIVVAVPYADAILTFRGGADGQEAPIRIIQGPKTGSTTGDRLDVDPIHNEIFVPIGNSIVVYPRDANGDVAPLRVIKGPDTMIRSGNSLAVDPVNNIIAMGLNSDYGDHAGPGGQDIPKGAILIFNRTDSGNVKPRAIIRGDKSGIIRINQIQVYPPRKLIIAAMPGIHDAMEPPSAFIGVWSYDDNGDVPPRWKIPNTPLTKLKKPFGVALNPKDKEVIVSDMRNNGVLVFSMPEIF